LSPRRQIATFLLCTVRASARAGIPLLLTRRMDDSLDICRKRLLFRSWRRGTREADLLFGSFAERHLESFGADRLACYERLLDEPDADLWDWVVHGVQPPPAHDTDLLTMLRNFRYTARQD
jgi:antitoxin CptB